MAAPVARRQLSSGHSIPALGLGVFQSPPGDETYHAVLSALQMGYRHIDTAEGYDNESDVGRAIKDSGIPREEIFVTSKYMSGSWTYHDMFRAVQQSVQRIGRYVDLYLMHAPGNSFRRADAWKALEDAQSQGLVRDIGVSNFGEGHLKKLAETWRVKPAVNQIELHPWLGRQDTVYFCESQGILLEAYSPLARAYKLKDPAVTEIAAQLKATSAQVLIAWSLAKGFIAIPKSVKAERQQENLEALELTLNEEQVTKLDALDKYMVTCWDPIRNHPV